MRANETIQIRDVTARRGEKVKAFLTKPYTATALLSTLRKVLAN